MGFGSWLVVVVGVLVVAAGGVKAPAGWRSVTDCMLPEEGAMMVGERIKMPDKGIGFGWSVAMSADASRVAVSAMGETGDSTFVRVYEKTEGGEWVQLGENIDGESTGSSVIVENLPVAMSADGNRVVIGVARRTVVGANPSLGSVVAYDWSDSGWIQVGLKLESDVDLIGMSLDMSADGRRIVVGVPNRQFGNRGVVRVYELNDDIDVSSEWVLVGEGIRGAEAGDEFGKFVSLSADGNLVAGGSEASDGDGVGNNAGQVRVFRLSDGEWVKVGDSINGKLALGFSGRCKLSADGSRVAVGGIWSDARKGRPNTGHVRVFQIDESSDKWEQVGGEIKGDAAGDWLGFSLALSGDGERVVLGAPGHDEKVDNAGSVQVYDCMAAENRSGVAWEPVGEKILGENRRNYFGWAVSMTPDGSHFAVSTFGTDGSVFIDDEENEQEPLEPQAGSVGVYALQRCEMPTETEEPLETGSEVEPNYESETETEMESESESESEAAQSEAAQSEAAPPPTQETPTATPPQPTTAPTPPPGDDGGGGVCFPGEATVRLHDGSTKTMEQLVVGDRVLVADGVFSDVFAFGHREPEAVSTFVRLETENGAVLKLSPSHYLPTADGALKAARELRVGDEVRRGDGKQDHVVAVSVEQLRGLYNPHTLQGSIVVDDVLASTYTESVHPGLAHILLAIPRALYRLNVKDPMGSLLHKSLPATLRALVPKGPNRLSR